jgi:hypothetical protein
VARMRRMNEKSKLPIRIENRLRAARAAAAHERAHMIATCRSGHFEGRPDEFIKERTRLYNQTWIIGEIDRVLAWARGEADCQGNPIRNTR